MSSICEASKHAKDFGLRLQKLDASSAKHESVQRELEAALEAQKLAHAEVQRRTSLSDQAQVSSHGLTCAGMELGHALSASHCQGIPQESGYADVLCRL